MLEECRLRRFLLAGVAEADFPMIVRITSGRAARIIVTGTRRGTIKSRLQLRVEVTAPKARRKLTPPTG